MVAILPDPGRPFQHCALFHDCAAADENRATNERFPNQLTEHRRLEPELEVARNLLERFPDIFVRLEQFRMCGVFELEEFGGTEHFVRHESLG